jgi:hypothetical protein
VLAFYYAWYDENTWTSGTTADTPLQLYRSSDMATIERHVSQAQAAGIDALVQSWYGPQEAYNQTETNFRVLLDVAASKGFHAAVAFETNGPFFPDQASVVEALRYLLSVHVQHPAYLRYRGRPVIFFWRQQRFRVETWETIRAEVDPDRTSIWIAEGTDLSFQRVFDGHYLYSVAWSSNVAHTLQDWGRRVRRYAQDHGAHRFWVATVMPGYDDTRSGRTAAFAVGRRNGDYYRATWSAAIASRPDWVVITSFNEWVEGTMIEPSARYGDLYLNLTRELSAQFKGSNVVETSPPELGAATRETSVPPPTATAGAIEDGPYVRAKETVRIRSGPDITYPRIGRLTQGEQAKVLARNRAGTWWQIKVPHRDALGWVNATFVELLGDASGLPIVELPTTTPQAIIEVSTTTPTAIRYVVTSTATRTPQWIKSPTAETIAAVATRTPTATVTHNTPLPLTPHYTQSAPLQPVARTPTVTIPPFITPRSVSTGTPSLDPANAANTTLTPQPLAERPSSVVTVLPSEEAVSPLSSAVSTSEGSSSAGTMTVRQPARMIVGDVPSLLWIGSVALVTALALLTALFVRMYPQRPHPENDREAH